MLVNFNFGFQVDEDAFKKHLESENRKMKPEYAEKNFEDACNQVLSNEFKDSIERFAYQVFISGISDDINDELMRDKNCWE